MGCTQSKGDPAVIGKSSRQPSKNLERANSMYENQKTDAATFSSDDLDKTPPQLNEKGHLTPEEVIKRTTCSETVETTIVGNKSKCAEPTEIKYASLTQRGFYPDNTSKPNQDSHSISLALGGEDGDAMFAVYDGHGTLGHDCATFAKKQLPRSVAKYIRQKRSQQHMAKLKAEGKPTKGAWNPSVWPTLDTKTYEDCCRKAFMETNKMMHDNPALDDKLSGTTAVSINFHLGRMAVCNVGDSRALLGRKIEKDTIVPIPLTRDQTPYRKDERERVKREGAEIKSIDQLKGREPIHEDWGDMLNGDCINIEGDPPRIWVKGNEFPGTAFTRSIGDSVAENIGVIADPEVVTKTLTESDKYLVIASDGVFEFLTNKQVMGIVEKCADPIQACKAIHEAAYQQWEEHENRTDDITVIVCFLSTSFAPAEAERGTTKDLLEDVDIGS